MDTTKSRKAVKVGRLARSEELDAGNADAAIAQGTTAGRLAAEAGMSLGELDAQVGGFCKAAGAWGAAVDGWYDAQPREATQDEVDHMLAGLRAVDNRGAHELVTRMWSELLLRRRG